jgi:hypothetical protein
MRITALISWYYKHLLVEACWRSARYLETIRVSSLAAAVDDVGQVLNDSIAPLPGNRN